MGGIVSTAAQSAANALPSLAAIRATRAADAPGARLASPAGGASPSYEQTIQVLELLQRANLPTELAICILDAAFVPLPEPRNLCKGMTYVSGSWLSLCALLFPRRSEYWPAVTAQMTGSIVASAGPRGDLVRTTLLVSPPLPHVESAPEHYARRISVWTDSRDQGRASRDAVSSFLLEPTRGLTEHWLQGSLPSPTSAGPAEGRRPGSSSSCYDPRL